KNYPVDVQAAAQALRARLTVRQKEQAAYLSRLTQELLQGEGKAERGKEVFFSRKAACYACHRAAGKGGNVGPDLSQIGRFRSPGDLLDALVFPSSAIAPEFRAFVVTTKKGQAATGMIIRETSDAIYLRTSDLAEIRIARQDVDEMTPSPTSLMP